jgi:diacylglycerol kinase family enzyme
MKHLFIIDSNAFFEQTSKMDSICKHIEDYFKTQENPDYSIVFSKYRREAIIIIKRQMDKIEDDKIMRVYAVGGEEILYDCLNGVVCFKNIELASVPYGEYNDFLSMFGEKKVELFRDISSIVQAKTIPTDAIKWGIHYSLNSCYIGLNSNTSKKLKEFKKNLNKTSFIIFSKLFTFLSYFISTFDLKTSTQEYKIFIDDLDYSGRYSLIHVANGPYHSGKMTGVSTATPDDGMLDIALIKSYDPMRTMLSLSKYSGGKPPSNSILLHAKKITVQSDRQIWMQMDREYFLDTNVSISVVPQAVNMAAVNDLTYLSGSESEDSEYDYDH